MSKNGKLDQIIMEAQDKSSNPFLTLSYRNIYSAVYVFRFLEKNYRLLFEMYNYCIKLDQSNDKYIRKKIKLRCKFIVSTLHTRHKVDFITFIAIHFVKEFEELQKWFISLYVNHKMSVKCLCSYAFNSFQIL